MTFYSSVLEGSQSTKILFTEIILSLVPTTHWNLRLNENFKHNFLKPAFFALCCFGERTPYADLQITFS